MITEFIIMVTSVRKVEDGIWETQVGRFKQFLNIRVLGLCSASTIIHYVILNKYH